MQNKSYYQLIEISPAVEMTEVFKDLLKTVSVFCQKMNHKKAFPELGKAFL